MTNKLERTLMTQQRIARIKEASARKGESLTRKEAAELLGMSQQNIAMLLKRHPEVLKFVKIVRPQEIKRLPATFIPEIEKVVRDIVVNHQAPTDDLVAKTLGLDREQFAKWMANHVPDPTEIGVLLPRDRLRVLYLSIGKIFQDLKLEFEPSSIAKILQRKEGEVAQYLKRNGELTKELIRMGMFCTWDEYYFEWHKNEGV